MKHRNESRIGDTVVIGGVLTGFFGLYFGTYAVAFAASRELRKNDEPWNLPVSQLVKCVDVKATDVNTDVNRGLRRIALAPVVMYDAVGANEGVTKIGVASTLTYQQEIQLAPYDTMPEPVIERKAVRLDDDPIDPQANVILVTSDEQDTFRVECPAPSLR